MFRGIACLLAAHYIVMMGRPNLNTFQALMIPSYYPTLLVNYAIALLVGIGVKKVTISLDRYHDWYRDIWRRAMLQFMFGVIGISILSFFLVWLYFLAFGQDIIDSGYLDYELPFSIALITILNFYYVAYYFYMYPRPIDSLPLQSTEESGIIELVPLEYLPQVQYKDWEMNENYGDPHLLHKELIEPEQKKEAKEILIVDTPLRSIPIRLKDVAMFFIFNKTLFIGIKGVKNLGDCYQYSGTLAELTTYFDDRDIFRINRQCIVNFNAIDAYENSGEKGLRVLLKPEFVMLDDIEANVFEKMCMVSGDKVTSFKEWMDR